MGGLGLWQRSYVPPSGSPPVPVRGCAAELCGNRSSRFRRQNRCSRPGEAPDRAVLLKSLKPGVVRDLGLTADSSSGANAAIE